MTKVDQMDEMMVESRDDKTVGLWVALLVESKVDSTDDQKVGSMAVN